MIEDKLKQANERERATRRNLALTLLCLFLPLGLFVAGVIRFDLSLFGLAPDGPSAQSDLGSEAAPLPPQQDAANGFGEGSEILAAAPVPRSKTAGRTTGGGKGSEVDRIAFQTALAAFEKEIEPKVSSEAYAAWSPESQAEILNAKSEALSLYGVGQYGSALERLSEGTARAEGRLAERSTAFQSSLDKAQAAYDSGDHDLAERYTLEALRIDPASQAAKGLKMQVDLLPELLTNIQRAKVVQVENDPVEEAAHLRSAVAPQREDLKARLRELEGSVKERTFSQHIRNGLDNLNAGRLAAARAELKAARTVYPGRPEADLLAERIVVAASKVGFARLVAEAEQSARADNWPEAHRTLEKAHAVRPHDLGLKLLLQTASEISALTRALASYNRQPQRLAAANVEAAARSDLERARAYADQSPKLARSTEILETDLERYTTEVSVRVVSDGATAITVHGVGRVGVVREKTISLRPGRYTFKGERRGYRSKLVEVVIEPFGAEMRVEVRCDEPV